MHKKISDVIIYEKFSSKKSKPQNMTFSLDNNKCNHVLYISHLKSWWVFILLSMDIRLSR